MSALAASIILHPNISQSLAVLATTLGRDKVSFVASFHVAAYGPRDGLTFQGWLSSPHA